MACLPAGEGDHARTSIGAVPDGMCRACSLWPPRRILHAELLPVLVALAAWGEHLRNQRVFFHIDSEAAKHLLIVALASSARPNSLFAIGNPGVFASMVFSHSK